MHLLKPLLLLLVISAQASEGRSGPGCVCFSRLPLFKGRNCLEKRGEGRANPSTLGSARFCSEKKRVKGFSIQRRNFLSMCVFRTFRSFGQKLAKCRHENFRWFFWKYRPEYVAQSRRTDDSLTSSSSIALFREKKLTKSCPVAYKGIKKIPPPPLPDHGWRDTDPPFKPFLLFFFMPLPLLPYSILFLCSFPSAPVWAA